MENRSTHLHHRVTLKPDGSEDRKSPEDRGADEFREGSGILPGDVTRRVFGSNPERAASIEIGRAEIAKAQRQIIAASLLLPILPYPGSIDAKGTEHVVRFRGVRVEKHQHSDGWAPVLDKTGMLGIREALPTEYLRRLDLQNVLFGDNVQIIGLTRANRFIVVQPTLRGGEPGENEIRDVLLAAGWQRVPIRLQNLPALLMGSAWWHAEEGMVLLDARKPNFKKTEFGVLPIDLILGDLSREMRERFAQAALP
jgi:hypothetical protein